jgi:hypothetical protein
VLVSASMSPALVSQTPTTIEGYFGLESGAVV